MTTGIVIIVIDISFPTGQSDGDRNSIRNSIDVFNKNQKRKEKKNQANDWQLANFCHGEVNSRPLSLTTRGCGQMDGRLPERRGKN